MDQTDLYSSSLLHLFRYLNVSDLLRAGRVCRLWHKTSNNPFLWQIVRMKGVKVNNFEGFANTLKKHCTVHLDFYGMILLENAEDVWSELSRAIGRVQSLRRIRFDTCPATVVEQIAILNPNLIMIDAVWLVSPNLKPISLDRLKSLTAIEDLRLRALKFPRSLYFSSISFLGDLKTLKTLSLTDVMRLGDKNVAAIGKLTNLELLELGHCQELPLTFGHDVLLKLNKLKKLRLETVREVEERRFRILESIKNMKELEELELVGLTAKPDMDKALGACKNIKKLMIILLPDPYDKESYQPFNSMVLDGVLKLQGTLTHFVWGVTAGLVDHDYITLEQPQGWGSKLESPSHKSGIVTLSLSNLQKKLSEDLETAHVKVVEIMRRHIWSRRLIYYI